MKKKDRNTDFNQNPSKSELIDLYIEQLEEKDKVAKTKKHKPRYKRRRRFLPPFLIIFVVICLIMGVGALFHFGIIKLPEFLFADTERSASSVTSGVSLPDQSKDTSKQEEHVSPERPALIYGATVLSGEDFELDNSNTFRNLALEAKDKGLTTLFVDFSGGIGLITDTAEGKTAVNQLISISREYNLTVFALVDISRLTSGDFTTVEATNYACKKMEELCNISGLGGIMLTGLELPAEKADYASYLATGTLNGYHNFCKERLTGLTRTLCDTVRNKNKTMLLGLVCDSVYATDKTMEGGMQVESDTELLTHKNADVLSWMESDFFDIVFVNVTTTTHSKKMPFETVVKWWDENTPIGCDLGFMLSSRLAAEAKGNWQNPDQLGRQLMAIKDISRFTFCFDSYSALINDTSGSSNLVYKYLKDGISDNYVLRDLTFTSPKKTNITTYESSISFVGASDPNFELTLDGKAVERTELGFFSLDIDLKVGVNTFTFSHKGKMVSYTINYRYVVIKDYSPTEKLTLEGGSSIMVKATARNGSTVKATLNSTTITLSKLESEEFSDFSTYSGIIELPSGYKEDTSLGKITFTGSHNGISESFKSGTVTVKKTKVEQDTSGQVPPNTGGYIGVGNTLIAEVTKYQVETFDGNTVDDYSQPYNNYLPKGTVDYCEEKTTYDPASGNTYRLLRYGKRVYTTSKGVANIRTLRGSLPETNQLSAKSVTTDGSHTILTLGSAWKAPFKFELTPQKYNSSSTDQRGAITSATFKYVDITFCYASSLKGNFEELKNSPVFSNVEIIKNTSDYTLRLHLKKVGAFYGWTAEYDADGNLVFSFLNPAKATAATNKYGGRLDGITIVIDAGHGGSDGGAVGSNPKYDEADRNLLLSKKVQKKLEELGAKVVMTRSSDVPLSSDDRILKVKNAKPNLAISIHRNASKSSSPNGFEAYHFNAYTKSAAEKIRDRMAQSGTYSRYNVKWHYFYLSRISDCPVVLTENGFMSNSTDFNNMLSDSWNDRCADSIVQGVVDYFLSIG